MKKEPLFTPVDLHSWKRGQMFYYFSRMAPTGYSITVDIDVTGMKKVLKKRNLKFFPAYIWLVTKTLNMQQEFRIAEKDGQVGYYDRLTPLYAAFHDDDKTFSLMWTEFDDDFLTFYKNYVENRKTYGENHGVLAQPEMVPPANAYTVSALPWVSFRHFSVHNYDNKAYYFPSVEAGKFREENGRLMMPLSLTCHHATTDGYHVHCFLQQLQNFADNLDDFLVNSKGL